MDKIEITLNQFNHYNSLKKQDTEHRKLIRKLQIEIRELKKVKSCSIPAVVKSLPQDPDATTFHFTTQIKKKT